MKSLKHILKIQKLDEVKKVLLENNYYISPLGLIMNRENDEYCLGEVLGRNGRKEWAWEAKVVLSSHVPDGVTSEQFYTEKDVLMAVLKNNDITYRTLR